MKRLCSKNEQLEEGSFPSGQSALKSLQEQNERTVETHNFLDEYVRNVIFSNCVALNLDLS